MLGLQTRRFFLSALGAGLAAPVLANAPSRSLRPVLRGADHHKKSVTGADTIVASAKLGGAVSFAVADVMTGKVLESREAAKGIPPASVTKSVTALYALSALGPNHRFRTAVIATGNVTNGRVKGDLILVGGGDPTLDSTDLANLAKQLKSKGIREVEGRFLVYDGALPQIDRIDAGQPDHVGYNPAISGIALNHNRVHFEWRRGANGYAVTMDARTAEYRPEVAIARMSIVARDTPVYTYKASKSRDEWTVARSALNKHGSRWLPVRLPGLYAGDVFRTMARAHGIVLKPAAVTRKRPQGTHLAEHLSPPLQSLVRDMLKFSNNLYAEMIGLAATTARKGSVNSLRASASEMSKWAGATLGMKRAKLVDHSGLGDASRMTATDMCAAMVRAENQGFRALLKPIAIRDERGRPVKNHPIKVAAKTGTLNYVSSLAGYITTQDGRTMSFAIFAADTATRAKISRADRERPRGARSWNSRAKTMQQKLIKRWAAMYGA